MKYKVTRRKTFYESCEVEAESYQDALDSITDNQEWTPCPWWEQKWEQKKDGCFIMTSERGDWEVVAVEDENAGMTVTD